MCPIGSVGSQASPDRLGTRWQGWRIGHEKGLQLFAEDGVPPASSLSGTVGEDAGDVMGCEVESDLEFFGQATAEAKRALGLIDRLTSVGNATGDGAKFEAFRSSRASAPQGFSAG